VMYLGRIVERASVEELFDDPKHPYTRALMRSIPQLGSRRKARLAVIEGNVPNAFAQIPGCAFHPRCAVAMPGVCDTTQPQLLPVAGTAAHVSCFLHHNPDGSPSHLGAPPSSAQPGSTHVAGATPL